MYLGVETAEVIVGARIVDKGDVYNFDIELKDSAEANRDLSFSLSISKA